MDLKKKFLISFFFSFLFLFIFRLNQAVELNQNLSYIYFHGGNGSFGYLNLNSNYLNDSQIKNISLTGWKCDENQCNFTLILDSDYYQKIEDSFNLTNLTGPIKIYYWNDGWRPIKELGLIGQGNCSFERISSLRTEINYTLAGSDGYDYGIRDAMPGGSYWLDEEGKSLDSGLVLYLKFSEGFGHITKDSSGYGNDGTLYDGNTTNEDGDTPPQWVDGKFGKALYFDGVDDYVSTSNSSSGFAEYTLMAWFRTTETAPDDAYGFRIVTVHRGAASTLASIKLKGGKVALLMHDGTEHRWLEIAKPYNDGKWHHLAGTVKNGEQKLYYDGVLIGTQNYPFIIQTTTYTDKIGTFDGTYGNFNGTIDEVRVYNRALSEEEIRALYQAGRIRLSNDFLTVEAHPSMQFNLTNGTAGLWNLITEEIKIDDEPLTNIYSIKNYSVYFFDWKSNKWKTWQKGANNESHGMPDWLDPRFKQAFKWKYQFKRDGYPEINFTFLMTAHDPFVRVFVDVISQDDINHKLDIPARLQQDKKMLDDGLVLYLPFEEGAGIKTYDYSNYGNDGTLYDGNTTNEDGDTPPQWVDGKFGKALYFDGVDDYVDTTAINITGPITITLWAKYNRASIDTPGVLINKYPAMNYWAFFLHPTEGSPVIGFVFENAGWKRTGGYATNILDNKWHFFAAGYDGSKLFLYEDGVLRAIANIGSDTIKISAHTIKIGGSTQPDEWFDGLIDEVRIYNRALSEEEIWQLYQIGQTRIKAGNYYYKNSTSDNVLFATQNFRTAYRGNFSNPNPSYFNLSENVTTKTLTYSYIFNSTLNKNFMFTLGTSSFINTTNFNPAINQFGYSSENLEQVANSTLTYYDILTYSKQLKDQKVEHNFALEFHYNETYMDDFGVGAYNYFGIEDSDEFTENYVADRSQTISHKIVNVSNNNVLFNLTDHDSFDQLYYDQRKILITGYLPEIKLSVDNLNSTIDSKVKRGDTILIKINISSDVEGNPVATLVFSNQTILTLSLSKKSFNYWEGNYTFKTDDPEGNYLINVTDDSIFSNLTSLSLSAKIIITLESDKINEKQRIIARPNTGIKVYGKLFYEDLSPFQGLVSLNYDTFQVQNQSDSDGNYSIHFSVPYEGIYNLRITAKDEFNNTAFNSTPLWILTSPLTSTYFLSFKISADKTDDNYIIGTSPLTQGSFSNDFEILKNVNELNNYYVCVFSQNKNLLLAIAHSYAKRDLEWISLNNSLANPYYTLTLKNSLESKLIIPFTQGNCQNIESKYYLIKQQTIPARPFTAFSFKAPESLPVIAKLKYEDVDIVNDEKFGKGRFRLCISYFNVSEANLPQIKVERC